MKRLGGLILIFAAAGLAAADGYDLQLFLDRLPTQAELDRNDTGAKHEPRTGCLLGAYIDLDSSNPMVTTDETGRTRRLPGYFESLAGRDHASYFSYVGYGSSFPASWAKGLAAEGRLIHIALEPNDGLEAVKDDATLEQLALDMKAVGAPIFLRFASEMNGTWTKYSGNPALYKEKWRIVARKMHELAPNVAMVWAPYTTPERTIPLFYPGDEYVDWVGVNMYSVTHFNQNPNLPARDRHPVEMLDYIYRTYSARKPIMIAEYGATHFSSLEKEPQTAFASGCIVGLYRALPRLYPRVKAIFYFNVNNLELSHRQNNNYAVTQNEEVLGAYRDVTSSPYFLSRLPEPEMGKGDAMPIQPDGHWPMAVRKGEKVSANITLSAWAQQHLEGYSVRFLANGRSFHTAGWDQRAWTVVLDTKKFENGPLEIAVRLSRQGKVISQKAWRLTVEN